MAADETVEASCHLLGFLPQRTDDSPKHAMFENSGCWHLFVSSGQVRRPGFGGKGALSLELAVNQLNEYRSPSSFFEVIFEDKSAPINMQIWVSICKEQSYFRCCMGILSVFVPLGVESPAASHAIAHKSSDVNKSLKGVRMREMEDHYSSRGELL